MRTIIRLLVILLAALAIVGATWTIEKNISSDTQTTFVQGDRPTLPEGFKGGEGGDSHAAQWTSLRGWMGFAETFAPLAIIITLIALPTSLWNRYHKVRQHKASLRPYSCAPLR